MNKAKKYENLITKAKSVLSTSDHIISRYANTCALIKEEFDWLWIGFYIVEEGSHSLYLGPFQGPLACTRIPFNKGVCGKAYNEAQTQVIDNVDDFPGHIACSSHSRSEVVVPVFNQENVLVAVLDIDSDQLSSFDSEDKEFLEILVDLLFQ